MGWFLLTAGQQFPTAWKTGLLRAALIEEVCKILGNALSIIVGTYGVLCLFRDDMCLCSTLWKKELSYLTKPADLLSQLHVPVGTSKDANMVIAAEYWRPDDCYEFAPSGKSEQPSDDSFPRRDETHAKD